MFLKGQAKYVPCALLHTPSYQSLAHEKISKFRIYIALTQLSLTLVSRVCQLCCNDIHRLIKSASITPRWEKGGTRPKCCISNCHAHHLQHQKLQLVSKYLKSFHALIFHALHHCVSGITILCMIQFRPNKYIASPATHLYATSV